MEDINRLKEEIDNLSKELSTIHKENDKRERIKNINPLEMTPMEALSFLYNLKKEIKNKK